ncbi:aromatic alcohol reductase [Paraburkholderia sp. 22B1P]|uniref:aromatic alcohol reductase n=1 Tax=Paraburkholderia sp. 22B1P TaxID=3080498 RepID=UPI003085761A|nr:aromatic alcohol reductase [Paraburkholderia sp. 22B1P]
MTQQRILILGAGELGVSVLRNLARRAGSSALSISVLLRPSTIQSTEAFKQRDIDELRTLGIEPVPGDLAADSVDTLAALFQRFDTVVSCAGFVGGKGVQLKIARAALDAGVPRFFPWQFGVDYDVIGRGSAQDLFDEQLDVRDLLRAQTRTDWVIVSTGMFTSFLFEPSFGVVDVERGIVRALGSWDNAVTVTTAEDIGVLTTEILLAEPRISRRVVHVAGETIGYRELADKLDAFTGRKFERVEWTVPQLRQELALDPDNGLKKYRVVFAEGKGVAWDARETFNVQRGIAVENVGQWMRRNLNVSETALAE